MSDADKMVTEREAVLRERGAFIVGARLVSPPRRNDTLLAETKARYPLPITRPRVLQDPDSESARQPRYFRLLNGAIECACRRSDRTDPWHWVRLEEQNHYSIRITPNRIRVWADLLANPTEQVPDDSPANDTSRDALEREVL